MKNENNMTFFYFHRLTYEGVNNFSKQINKKITQNQSHKTKHQNKSKKYKYINLYLSIILVRLMKPPAQKPFLKKNLEKLHQILKTA